MIGDLPSQFQWLWGRARARLSGFVQDDPAVSVEIAVTSGLMQGEMATFAQNEISLGSGDTDDSQLFDEGVVEGHATLRMRRSIFGTLATVQTGDGKVQFAGETVAQNTRSGEYRLPVDIVLGGTTLHMRSSAMPEIQTGRFIAGALASAVAAFGLLAVLLFPTQKSTLTFRAVESPRATVTHVADRPSIATSVHARGRLIALGLTPFLSTDVADNGTLTVSGVIPSRLERDWRQFTQWYDSQPSAPVLVRQVTVTQGLNDLPPIALIQLHTPKRVFFADGTVSVQGDVIFDNWAIDAIDTDALTLTRQGERIRVAY